MKQAHQLYMVWYSIQCSAIIQTWWAHTSGKYYVAMVLIVKSAARVHAHRVVLLSNGTCDDLYEHFTFLRTFVYLHIYTSLHFRLQLHVHCSCFLYFFPPQLRCVFICHNLDWDVVTSIALIPLFRHCLLFYTNFQFYTHTPHHTAISRSFVKCISCF